jgi:hypothetical protein
VIFASRRRMVAGLHQTLVKEASRADSDGVVMPHRASRVEPWSARASLAVIDHPGGGLDVEQIGGRVLAALRPLLGLESVSQPPRARQLAQIVDVKATSEAPRPRPGPP